MPKIIIKNNNYYNNYNRIYPPPFGLILIFVEKVWQVHIVLFLLFCLFSLALCIILCLVR